MTGAANSIDTARVELLLNELRLPGVKAIWPKLAVQSDKEGWPAAHSWRRSTNTRLPTIAGVGLSGTWRKPACPP